MKLTEMQEKSAPAIHRAFMEFVDARRDFTLGEFEQYITEHIQQIGGEGFVASIGEAIVRAAALSQAPAPEGWVLVPVEPTSEMLTAGHDAAERSAGIIVHEPMMPSVYRAMLAAEKRWAERERERCAQIADAAADVSRRATGKDEIIGRSFRSGSVTAAEMIAAAIRRSEP